MERWRDDLATPDTGDLERRAWSVVVQTRRLAETVAKTEAMAKDLDEIKAGTTDTTGGFSAGQPRRVSAERHGRRWKRHRQCPEHDGGIHS